MNLSPFTQHSACGSVLGDHGTPFGLCFSRCLRHRKAGCTGVSTEEKQILRFAQDDKTKKSNTGPTEVVP